MQMLGLLIVLTGMLSGTAQGGDCAALDKDLLFCPAPKAPTITELRGGSVTLELRLGTDGSVASSTVLASVGHPAWVSAAQSAVMTWRYSPGPKGRTRVVPFAFDTDAAASSNHSFKVTRRPVTQLAAASWAPVHRAPQLNR